MRPPPSIQVLRNFQRHDVLGLLEGAVNVGVELGVAEGVFSQRMMASGKFTHVIGIDMYADSHDVQQYKTALRKLRLLSSYKLLRMRFDEALDLFDDESLDFLYVDGYAHGGEEGGETIFDWYPKVKDAGWIAGDDYHADWPLVCEAVNEFAAQLGEPILLTELTEPDNAYCRYPTWAIRKSRALDLTAPLELIRRGKRENARIARLREGGFIKRNLRRVVPAVVLRHLKELRSGRP